MLKNFLLFILLIFILGACDQQESVDNPNSPKSPIILLEEVEASIKEQGLKLEKADLPNNNVFIQALNGVTPKVYFLDGTTLSIYVFLTTTEREKGMEAFEELTAAAELVSHKTYVANNVLVFYTEGKEEINNRLSAAFDGLGK